MRKIFITNTQMALFFKDYLPQPENFWQDIKAKTNNVLDVTPLIVPVPNDSRLADVPVVQLFSVGKKYSCNIARGRIDFFINEQPGEKLEEVKKDLIEKTKVLFSMFSTSPKIKRVGFVTRFFIDNSAGDLSVAKIISENFKKQHSGSIHETYVKFVTRTTYLALQLNNYTTIENVTRKTDHEVVKGVLITRDFNTAPEDDCSAQLSDEAFVENFVKFGSAQFKLDELISCL